MVSVLISSLVMVFNGLGVEHIRSHRKDVSSLTSVIRKYGSEMEQHPVNEIRMPVLVVERAIQGVPKLTLSELEEFCSQEQRLDRDLSCGEYIVFLLYIERYYRFADEWADKNAQEYDDTVTEFISPDTGYQGDWPWFSTSAGMRLGPTTRHHLPRHLFGFKSNLVRLIRAGVLVSRTMERKMNALRSNKVNLHG